MIFFHTADKVLSGEKTQTRRLKGNYAVGKTYSVQPGRGKKAVARIRITLIRREDVRWICYNDVLAEGFESSREFLALWVKLHDRTFREDPQLSDPAFLMGLLDRPEELYLAWVLHFELVKD